MHVYITFFLNININILYVQSISQILSTNFHHPPFNRCFSILIKQKKKQHCPKCQNASCFLSLLSYGTLPHVHIIICVNYTDVSSLPQLVTLCFRPRSAHRSFLISPSSLYIGFFFFFLPMCLYSSHWSSSFVSTHFFAILSNARTSLFFTIIHLFLVLVIRYVNAFHWALLPKCTPCSSFSSPLL